jgi:hypothetical protein
MKSIKLVLACALLSAQALASAGSVDGPYVVWINLSGTPDTADQRIRQFVNSGKAECWNSEAVLFMRDKPKTITPALVTRALIDNDKAAIKEVNKLLKRGHGEMATGGFDGVVAYTDQPKSAVYSLTTGERKVVHVSFAQAKDLETSFCKVLPMITRAP